MPRAYSNDLRERVVAAADRGLSASGAACIFGVSISTAIRWTRRVRDTGSATAKPYGGDTHSKLTDQAIWLMELISQQPDLTLMEIQQRFRDDKAVALGYGTVWRFSPAGDIRPLLIGTTTSGSMPDLASGTTSRTASLIEIMLPGVTSMRVDPQIDPRALRCVLVVRRG